MIFKHKYSTISIRSQNAHNFNTLILLILYDGWINVKKWNYQNKNLKSPNYVKVTTIDAVLIYFALFLRCTVWNTFPNWSRMKNDFHHRLIQHLDLLQRNCIIICWCSVVVVVLFLHPVIFVIILFMLCAHRCSQLSTRSAVYCSSRVIVSIFTVILSNNNKRSGAYYARSKNISKAHSNRSNDNSNRIAPSYLSNEDERKRWKAITHNHQRHQHTLCVAYTVHTPCTHTLHAHSRQHTKIK